MKTSQLLQRSAAVCMAGAAFIHFGVAGEHFALWWLYGVFFLLLAAGQVTWAALCWQSARRALLVVGVLGNLGVVALWVITRTVGLPFGPAPGVAEAVGVPDVLCAVLELVSVGLTIAVLLRVGGTAPGRQWDTRSATVLTAAVAAVVMLTTGVAIADPGTPRGSSDSMAMNGSGAMGSPAHGGMSDQGNGERHQMSQLPQVNGATSAQTSAAQDFLAKTIADTAKYRDTTAAVAAGFDVPAAVQKHDKKHPNATAIAIKVLHVPNKANRADGKVLDPAAPETLIYARSSAGEFTLIGVMYTAEKKNPPTVYQPYLRWHYHESCKGGGKEKVMPSSAGCPAGSTLTKSGYMTHVWFVESSKLVYAFAMSAPRAQIHAYQATLK